MITPLYLTSTVTNAAAPFTVGHPFAKGQVPAGSNVIADIADFQCAPKTYWEDGSLKFAILSGRASLAANVEKTVTLDVGTVAAGTALTIADLKAATPTVSIALNSPKDWTFGTASQTVGAKLAMSNALDVLDAASSTITVDNGATIGTVTAAQVGSTIEATLTAPLSGGTVGGYQTVKYRAKYKVKRNISAITQGPVTRITVTGGWKTAGGSATDGIGVSIAAVGDTITFAGIVGMTQLNGLTGTVTARDTASSRAWVEVNIDSTAFTAYTSGGTATKNQLNTSDSDTNGKNLDTIAYVRTGGGLEWNGSVTTYSAANSTGQTSVSWATTEWDTPFEVLESGPKMSSWKYRKAVAPDPHMVAWLEVRLYVGGAVQILPYIENGYLKTLAPTAKQATFVLTINSVERFNQALELKAHSRTTLINGTHLCYWTITDPNVAPRHERDYIYSTRLIPTYRHVTPDTASTMTAAAPAGPPTTFVPFQRGNWQAAMGSAGFQADIGIIPNHDALYFTNGSRKAFEGMVRNALSTGRYRFHYRDETTNRPIRFSDYPNLVINGTGTGVGGVGVSSVLEYTPAEVGGTAAGAQFVSSHHPSMGYVPYMITGWNYFLEEMHFLATLLFLKQVNTERGLTKGILKPEVGANQTRGAAWALRTLTQAATLTRDNDPYAAELRTSLENNILHNHAKYIAPGDNCPFGFMELYTDYNSGSSTGMYASGFQQDFMTQTFGFMKSADPLLSTEARSKLAEFFVWKAQSAIGRLGGTAPDEYLFRDSGFYKIPLSVNQLNDAGDGRPPVNWDASKGPTGPWHANWGVVWDILAARGAEIDFPGTVREDGPLRDGNFPTAGSYQANLLPAISYAVEHGVPGALAAYNRLVGASNWSSQDAAFVAYPVYGIKPLAIAEAEEPVPVPVTTPRGQKVRVAKTGLIPGKVIIGITGFGVLAEDIPEIGTDGPGLNYNGLSFPADAGKEILLEVLTAPTGVLTITSKYGATYDGGTSSLTYKVYSEGVFIGNGGTTFNMVSGSQPLPVGTVTAQTKPDTNSVRFVGTASNAVSGLYSLSGSGGGVSVGPLSFVVTNSTFDFTVSGLVPGTYVPSLTVTGPGGTAVVSGTSAFSATVVGSDPDPDPDPVGDIITPIMVGEIAIDLITYNVIGISWQAATDNVGVVGYQFSSDGGGSYTGTGTAQNAVVGDLQAGASYTFMVRAVDEAGNISLPLTRTIQTLEAPPPVLPDPTPAPTLASRSLAWLKDATARWSHRSDLGPMFDDFVMLAEKRINGDLEARLQVAATTLATTARLDGVLLPPDVAEVRALSIPVHGALEYVSPETYYAKVSQKLAGPPKHFTVIGSFIYLNPVPDAVYAMACAYQQKIPSLLDEADGVNWLIRDHPDIYLAAVMCEALNYIENVAKLPVWEAKYQDAVGSLNSTDWHTGTSLCIRPDSPTV